MDLQAKASDRQHLTIDSMEKARRGGSLKFEGFQTMIFKGKEMEKRWLGLGKALKGLKYLEFKQEGLSKGAHSVEGCCSGAAVTGAGWTLSTESRVPLNALLATTRR